jgi:MerR family transcriptional regulator, light-induced transcriptional regulator
MNSNAAPTETAQHRIGAISHFSGVPVSTLRVWEVRYSTFAPAKSEGNQRLYSDDDALKASLLKQLIQCGHPIASIARHSTATLNQLLQQKKWNRPPQSGTTQPLLTSTIVVGLALARRLNTTTMTTEAFTRALKIEQIYPDLDSAKVAAPLPRCQLLMVRINSLHTVAQEEIQQLQQQCGAHSVFVVYNFGQQWVIEAMKQSGITVRREPLSDTELAEQIAMLLHLPAPSATPAENTAPVIKPQPRKYSDEVLAQVAAIPNNVLCECPRHVAEILTQLSSFEQYSSDCLSRSPADAQLHGYLREVSGTARTIFEQALEKIAAHEGIVLQSTP